MTPEQASTQAEKLKALRKAILNYVVTSIIAAAGACYLLAKQILQGFHFSFDAVYSAALFVICAYLLIRAVQHVRDYQQFTRKG